MTVVTIEQRDRILRLLGEENPDGTWALDYDQIAEKMKLHVLAVKQVERTAAVRWGKQHRWNARSYD